MSNQEAVPDHRVAAKATGLQRYFRRWAIDVVNRIVVALIIVGGIATALSSRSSNAMLVAALTSVLVAVVLSSLVVMRYWSIRRRLSADPAGEVARLSAKPGRHQREFFAGGELRSPEPRAGEYREGFDPNAPDPYAAMRDVDLQGQKSEASQDGVNRTEDPGRGEID